MGWIRNCGAGQSTDSRRAGLIEPFGYREMDKQGPGLVWEKTGDHYSKTAMVDSAGNIYCVVGTVLYKFDANGDEVDSRNFGGTTGLSIYSQGETRAGVDRIFVYRDWNQATRYLHCVDPSTLDDFWSQTITNSEAPNGGGDAQYGICVCQTATLGLIVLVACGATPYCVKAIRDDGNTKTVLWTNTTTAKSVFMGHTPGFDWYLTRDSDGYVKAVYLVNGTNKWTSSGGQGGTALSQTIGGLHGIERDGGLDRISKWRSTDGNKAYSNVYPFGSGYNLLTFPSVTAAGNAICIENGGSYRIAAVSYNGGAEWTYYHFEQPRAVMCCGDTNLLIWSDTKIQMRSYSNRDLYWEIDNPAASNTVGQFVGIDRDYAFFITDGYLRKYQFPHYGKLSGLWSRQKTQVLTALLENQEYYSSRNHNNQLLFKAADGRCLHLAIKSTLGGTNIYFGFVQSDGATDKKWQDWVSMNNWSMVNVCGIFQGGWQDPSTDHIYVIFGGYDCSSQYLTKFCKLTKASGGGWTAGSVVTITNTTNGGYLGAIVKVPGTGRLWAATCWPGANLHTYYSDNEGANWTLADRTGNWSINTSVVDGPLTMKAQGNYVMLMHRISDLKIISSLRDDTNSNKSTWGADETFMAASESNSGWGGTTHNLSLVAPGLSQAHFAAAAIEYIDSTQCRCFLRRYIIGSGWQTKEQTFEPGTATSSAGLLWDPTGGLCYFGYGSNDWGTRLKSWNPATNEALVTKLSKTYGPFAVWWGTGAVAQLGLYGNYTGGGYFTLLVSEEGTETPNYGWGYKKVQTAGENEYLGGYHNGRFLQRLSTSRLLAFATTSTDGHVLVSQDAVSWSHLLDIWTDSQSILGADWNDDELLVLVGSSSQGGIPYFYRATGFSDTPTLVVNHIQVAAAKSGYAPNMGVVAKDPTGRLWASVRWQGSTVGILEVYYSDNGGSTWNLSIQLQSGGTPTNFSPPYFTVLEKRLVICYAWNNIYSRDRLHTDGATTWGTETSRIGSLAYVTTGQTAPLYGSAPKSGLMVFQDIHSSGTKTHGLKVAENTDGSVVTYTSLGAITRLANANTQAGVAVQGRTDGWIVIWNDQITLGSMRQRYVASGATSWGNRDEVSMLFFTDHNPRYDHVQRCNTYKTYNATMAGKVIEFTMMPQNTYGLYGGKWGTEYLTVTSTQGLVIERLESAVLKPVVVPFSFIASLAGQAIDIPLGALGTITSHKDVSMDWRLAVLSKVAALPFEVLAQVSAEHLIPIEALSEVSYIPVTATHLIPLSTLRAIHRGDTVPFDFRLKVESGVGEIPFEVLQGVRIVNDIPRSNRSLALIVSIADIPVSALATALGVHLIPLSVGGLYLAMWDEWAIVNPLLASLSDSWKVIRVSSLPDLPDSWAVRERIVGGSLTDRWRVIPLGLAGFSSDDIQLPFGEVASL